MLSGPTDFKEAKNDKNIIKILPNKRCSVHQRNLNVNYQKFYAICTLFLLMNFLDLDAI